MKSVSPRILRAVAWLAVVGTAAAVSALSCGNLGQPPFEGADGGVLDSATAANPPFDAITEGGLEGATATLRGIVVDPAGKPVATALVAIEVGGLDQINPSAVGPDGGTVATIKIDPYYRLGAITDESGKFMLDVPDETVGVHVYKEGFYCGVPDAGAIPAEAGSVTVRLVAFDGGTSEQPRVTGFSINTGSVEPQVAAPGVSVTLAALVEAADSAADPLSEQILAIEPTIHFAGAFAPPSSGTPGKGYPNGVYGRLVTAPLVPGEYTYYVVAATEGCIVGRPVSRKLLVTPTGDGGFVGEASLVDASLPDAGEGG